MGRRSRTCRCTWELLPPRLAKAVSVVEQHVHVQAVTWIVNGGKPDQAALDVLLKDKSQDVQLVCIGLQVGAAHAVPVTAVEGLVHACVGVVLR